MLKTPEGKKPRVRRKKAPIFTARQVCVALGVPHGTLNSWAHYGFFRGLDAENTRPGKPREFTLADLFRLGISKRLLDLGISGEQARSWAQFCVRYMDRHGPHVTKCHVLLYPDDPPEIRFDDELMSTPVRPGAELSLTLYLNVIVNALKARLGETMSIGVPQPTSKHDC